jgi:predicted dehydrogenase
LTTTLEEARRLRDKARATGRIFAVTYNYSGYPLVRHARSMVQGGELGAIRIVQVEYPQDWLADPLEATGQKQADWRTDPARSGSGCVGDIGTHWIDTVSFILGTRAESVFAHLETFHKTRKRPRGEVKTFAKAATADLVSYNVDTEDFGSVLLKFGKAKHGFANAVHANASISQVAAGWKCSLSLGIYGTQCSVRWDLQQPNEIIVGRRDEPNQILQRATAGFSKDVAGFTDYPGGHPEGFPDSHKMHCRAVYEHIASNRKTPALFATAKDGHHEVQLCEAILKSARAKRWVRV